MKQKTKEIDIVGEGYRYFAFISYKRTDSKWADWMYRKLQSYRLPSKLCKKYEGIPKKFNPVFIDKQELLPGSLSDNLKKNIAESKFFVAICSENCKDNPIYIDMELKYFLETHDNDHTKVIPFIVDDSPKPEEECFSPEMQKLCAEHGIIGTNITEKGKKTCIP